MFNSGKNLIIIILLSCISWSLFFSEDLNARNTVNQNVLNDMVKKIENEKIGIHSVVILKNGDLVFEKYFNQYNKDKLHLTYHILNNIISSLIGICIDQGLIKNVDQKIITFFPEYSNVITDKRQFNITIKHLLTMSGGYKWNSEHHNDPIKEFVENSNLLEYMFKCQLVNEPGTSYSQNSGDIFLLAKIIEKVSSKTISEFADEKLFKPLGISDYKWERDPKGKTKGPYALYMKPIDMAKYGYLISNNGKWNNKQIVSKEWINESTKLHFKLNPRFQIFKELNEQGAGYFWWIFPDMIAAQGHSGQKIFILKEENIVIVFTAATPFDTPVQLFKDFIKKSIL